MEQAQLIEIFQSLQGEGPYVGIPMVFVRFQDCALSCQYCDTPASFKKHPEFRLESPPGSMKFVSQPNPIGVDSLTEILTGFDGDTVSITGGEPLQHSSFLAEWLPALHGKVRILLETNGVLTQELTRVLSWVDIISMDIKLPSATGMRPYWEEHQSFLQVAQAKELYVKVVVTADTPREEIRQAVDLVQKQSPKIPFILQPVTPFGPVRESTGAQQLQEFYQFSCQFLQDVRVIPQVHAALGIL